MRVIDPELIRAAQQGDSQALLSLLKVSQPQLRRIASIECASAADADDAVQESLWHVYRRIGTLRTMASYAAWLYMIVRRECRRMMRRMRGHEELPGDESPLVAYTPRPDLQVDLAAALESLPAKYREAILLRDVQEYSIAEMALTLKLTRAAVKSRIHRGREMIREYLRD